MKNNNQVRGWELSVFKSHWTLRNRTAAFFWHQLYFEHLIVVPLLFITLVVTACGMADERSDIYVATDSNTLDLLDEEHWRALDSDFSARLDRIAMMTHQADIDKLLVMRGADDSSVALAASWENVRRAVPVVRRHNAVPVNNLDIERFLGFVEGRIKVTIPAWWENAFQNATAFSRDNIVIGKLSITESLTHEVMFGVTRLSLPVNTTAAEIEKSVCFNSESVSVNVTKELLKTMIAKGGRRIAFGISREFVLIGCYDGRITRYPLVCIDRDSGKILWATLAGGGNIRADLGLSHHYSEIIVLDERVFVYGTASAETYINEFDLNTGESLLHMTTGK